MKKKSQFIFFVTWAFFTAISGCSTKKEPNSYSSRNPDKIQTLYLDINVTTKGHTLVNFKDNIADAFVNHIEYCDQFKYKTKNYILIFADSKKTGRVFWVFKTSFHPKYGKFTFIAKQINVKHKCKYLMTTQIPSEDLEQILKTVDKGLIKVEMDSEDFSKSPKELFTISDMSNPRFRSFKYALPNEIQLKTDFGDIYYTKLERLKIGEKTRITLRIVEIPFKDLENLDIEIKLKADAEHLGVMALNVQSIQRFNVNNPPYWEWELTPISSGTSQLDFIIGKKIDDDIVNNLGSERVEIMIESNPSYTLKKEIKEGWKGFLLGLLPYLVSLI
jgi:hypothetical protein